MELHFLTIDEIDLINLKLAKNHRSQKDYNAIDSLLMDKDLYVVECLTAHPEIQSCSSLMCVGGMLLAFTSQEACSHQMETFANNVGMDLEYNLKAMAFEGVAGLADKEKMKLAIDLDSTGERSFLLYGEGRYDVVRMDGRK